MTTRRALAAAKRALRADRAAELDAELDRAATQASMFFQRRASLGGRARAAALSPLQRSAIARQAALSRWKRSDG